MTRFAKGTFLRSVATLMSGALLAQALGFAVTPLLARLFSPGDFGLLRLLNSAAGLFVGVAALRYDMAIVVPKRDADAAALLGLSTGLVGGMSLLCLVVMAVGGDTLSALLGGPGSASWLLLAPLIVLATGLYNALQFWCTRRQQYGRLSAAAVTAGVTSAAGKLGGGLARFGAPGLVGGQIIGQAIATLVLGWQVLRRDGALLKGALNRDRLRAVAREYREFPIYQSPMTFINVFTQNLPVFALGTAFGVETVGFWALTFLLLATPTQLLARSLKQVLYQRMSALLNEGRSARLLYVKATLALLAVTVPVALLAVTAAPWLFEVVLGEEWAESARFARWVAPWQLSVLLSTPAVALFPAIRIQRAVLAWQSAGTVLCVGVLWVTRDLEPVWVVASYSLAMTALNLVLVLMVGAGAGRTLGRKSIATDHVNPSASDGDQQDPATAAARRARAGTPEDEDN